MANGDITNTDVQAFRELGTLSSGRAAEIDLICDNINSDVNLILRNLGIVLPVTDSDSVLWLKFTKLLGASSMTMELLSGQSTEEENTRAQRDWDKYKERIDALINSGGEILEVTFSTDPIISTLPALVGVNNAEQRKRFLRFPQRAAADQYTDEATIRKTRAPWKTAIRGL